MSGSDELITLTRERGLVGARPVIRILTPVGDEAWLVNGHAELRKLLLDRRLGRTHPDPDNAPKYLDDPMLDKWRSDDFASEHDVHAGLRAVLVPYFSGRNMRALQPQLALRVDEAVARLGSQARPVDIYSQFSLPLTARVLGDLLGAPDEDGFPALAYQLSDVASAHHVEGGKDALMDYLCGLAARKRAEPGRDVLSGLAAAGCADKECAWIAFILLAAGLNSTSGHTTLGIARMADDPVLRDRLAADPSLMKPAVDEFLRTASSDGLKFPYYARDDIEIGGVTIRAGDLVLLNFDMANFDERVFPAPDEMDITRSPNPHLSFSHGMWYCIGAPLATMQLTTAFTAVLAALPTLRLVRGSLGAKPLAEMAPWPGRPGDLAELLVTW